jgi:hypothetical protein
MEFRVREEYDGEYIHYYPQVKGGILGKLGIWRYFTPLHYECNRYSIWAKTELMRSVPVEKWDRELAEKDIEKFIQTLVPFKPRKHKKKRVSYKYRTVGSDGTVRYV